MSKFTTTYDTSTQNVKRVRPKLGETFAYIRLSVEKI